MINAFERMAIFSILVGFGSKNNFSRNYSLKKTFTYRYHINELGDRIPSEIVHIDCLLLLFFMVCIAKLRVLFFIFRTVFINGLTVVLNGAVLFMN